MTLHLVLKNNCVVKYRPSKRHPACDLVQLTTDTQLSFIPLSATSCSQITTAYIFPYDFDVKSSGYLGLPYQCLTYNSDKWAIPLLCG